MSGGDQINDVSIDEITGRITVEEGDRRRAAARERAEEDAIRKEKDYINGCSGSAATLPLPTAARQPAFMDSNIGSRPSFVSRVRLGGRARTLALASGIARLLQPLALALLWLVPGEWAQHMREVDDESGQGHRFVLHPIQRRVLSVLDFLTGRGVALGCVAVVVFLTRDVYINQRHSLLGRLGAVVFSESVEVTANTPYWQRYTKVPSEDIHIVSRPGERSFIEHATIRPVTPKEMQLEALIDVDMFSQDGAWIGLTSLEERLAALNARSAPQVGVPRQILYFRNNTPPASYYEWFQRLSECSGMLINPRTYDASETGEWIVIEHTVFNAVGIKEMCTLRGDDAATTAPLLHTWERDN